MNGTDSGRSGLSPHSRTAFLRAAAKKHCGLETCAQTAQIPGRPVLKLVWLTSLMLVAGTLSTRAWAVPVEKEAAKPARSGSSAPAKPGQSREEPERILQIAPQADVWNGVSDRPLVQPPSGEPEQPPAPASDEAEVRLPSLVRRVELPAGPKTEQRCRLICRYAHAPPVEQ